jgi:hypothetical protein
MVLSLKDTPARCSYICRVLAVPRPQTPPATQSSSVGDVALCQATEPSLAEGTCCSCTFPPSSDWHTLSTRCWEVALAVASSCEHNKGAHKQCNDFSTLKEDVGSPQHTTSPCREALPASRQCFLCCLCCQTANCLQGSTIAGRNAGVVLMRWRGAARRLALQRRAGGTPLLLS